MKKIKFSQIKSKIVNNPGFRSLKEIKEAGYRIVKERDGDRYFLARKEDLKPLLVRLGDVAEVRRGFTTGCNEFFYLPNKHFDIKKEGKYYELIPKHEGLPRGIKIEEEFLRPVIKGPKDCRNILIEVDHLRNKIFICNKTKQEIKEMSAYKYITWGEFMKFDLRETTKNRISWWNLGTHRIPTLTIIKGPWLRHFIPINKAKAFCDQQIYEVIFNENIDPIKIGLIVNSTLSALFFELNGRSNFGEGILWLSVYEAADLFIIEPKVNYKITKKVQQILKREVHDIFTELGIKPNLPIREQTPNPLPDRKALDDIVFDILGLTEDERKEVYWAVCELVKSRLEKARSVRYKKCYNKIKKRWRYEIQHNIRTC